ncbi:hypothetical protein [Klebsiella pasteurii]|uniref:hypothetical protein n=1 Tax=Klebsiella pasteurii TaxID=2587529 RepID=UPI0018C77A95|nr:hypothetical protein [Klebsiella pasteurii]MBG2716908.1 hypothetical protein [Klebsiella michiganensis]MDS7909938.1 hypothetical protein [Klebsiella pasteurii]
MHWPPHSLFLATKVLERSQAAQWRDDEDFSPSTEAEGTSSIRIFVKYCFKEKKIINMAGSVLP